MNFKDDLIEYKCLCSNKNYQQKFDEKLKERFFNIKNFLTTTIISLFYCYEKVFILNEHIDNLEKFIETSLPEKEDFYIPLNMEDITDDDYVHAKRVCKDFETKNLGEYHDLYFQRDAILLADVFEIFRSICIKIYEFDPAKFLSASGLA